jgi:ankyrin repeat protein
MAINKKNIYTPHSAIRNFFTNLGLAICYSRYKNNFNIVCENIEFEDINLKGVGDWFPLYYAVIESNRHSTLETVKLILKHSPDIDAKTTHENTALISCCQHINSSSNIETMNLLLEYNADVNLVDNYGQTALIRLILNENLKATKILLKYGAKINIKNIYNESAIDISIKKYKFNCEITQTLLNYDKNINYNFSNYLDINFIHKN